MAHGEDALVALIRTRSTALVRYAFLLTGDPHEAEELAQDALVTVCAGRGRRAAPEALEAYVRTVMLNRVIDQSRRRIRWARLLPKVAAPTSVAPPDDAVATSTDIRTALRALSPRQRACVVLRFYEDLPVRDIAARLGLTEGTVKRHLFVAGRQLMALLTARTMGDGDGERV
jgi:RNA polymerase sigma factor (sigma-70 family)